MTDEIFYFDLNDGRSLNRDNMLKELQVINLTDCNLITGRALRAIGNRCNSLKTIVLHGCEKVFFYFNIFYLVLASNRAPH